MHHAPAWTEIDSCQWGQWLAQHTLVESDTFGPKVLRCDNGDYIKIFRIKHRISLSRIINPALRFCRNATRLRNLGFATVTPLALYRIPEKKRWAVRYAPLQGETLRHLMQTFSLPESVIADFGKLIANLHGKGVYFRSLHLGNIVLQPDGNLGLIDILDCRFRWFGRCLTSAQRERNFQHLFRYEDAKLIEPMLRDSYQRHCNATNQG